MSLQEAHREHMQSLGYTEDEVQQDWEIMEADLVQDVEQKAQESRGDDHHERL